MNSSIRTCYIAAPAGTNLEVLRRALSKRNVEVLVPDVAAEGADLQGQVSLLMTRVDLVIGVLTAERRSSWVLFDLGLAWANKRPIMLISSPKNDFIPSNLQRFLVLRAHPSNAEAIEFALDQFLAAPLGDRQTSVAKSPETMPPNPAIWLNTAEQAIFAIRNGDGKLLEQLLAQALRQSGVEVVSEFATDDGRRADIAIWSDALDPIIGNPLLVEVKLRLLSTSEAKNVAHALANQLFASGTQWGLLLYGEGSSLVKKSRGWLPPNVLAIDLPTLFDRMKIQSFSDVVRDLRNQKVHGSYP